MSRRPLAGIAAAALTILLAWSAYWALRIGYADYLAQDHALPATRAALRLTPSDPALHMQLARALLSSKAPDPSIQRAAVEDSLNDALHLSPANSTLWIESADAAEQLHDYPTAEADLLHAVQLDRTFSPRWLLAEFYARRQDDHRFWPAMRAALATSYDDVTPLFETCWNLTSQPETILPRAIPPRPEVLTQYLDFLLTKNRLDLAQPVAAQLLPHPTPATLPTLLAYCDRLLWFNQPIPARHVWNVLSAARLIPYPSVAGITNPAFEKPFLQQAFDWRLASAPGTSAQHDPALLTFEFSGKQIEHAELASQFVLLAPATTYRLTVSSRNETDVAALIPGIVRTPDTGVHLHLIQSETHLDFLASAPPVQGPDRQPQTQTYPFTTPLNSNLFRLTVTYDRTYGTTRFEGAVSLSQLQLAK